MAASSSTSAGGSTSCVAASASWHGVSEIDWDEVLSRLPLEAIGEFINPSGQTWRDLMDHDTLDDFWRAIRFDDRYGTIDVPCLHVTGWYDLEDLLGAFHHYEGMMAPPPPGTGSA